MKTKRKMPDIRFRGFSDDWEQCKLGDVAKFKQGVQVDLNLQYLKKTEETERFIRIVDYTQDTDELRYVMKDITSDRVDEKDIVMVRYGATAGFVGRGITGIIANNMFTISPNENLKKSFLYTFLKMEKIYTKLNSSNGSSAMPALNFGMVGDINLSYPTRAEQHQIGTFFKNLDNLITLHQRKLQQLKEVKRGMLLKMFPEDKGNPNIRVKSCDEEWSTIKLKDIGDSYNGLTGKTKKDFGKGLGEFVTYLNVFNNPIADISLTENVDIDKTQNEVKRGDVFFTVSSETPHEVGMASVWLDDRPNVYLNSFCFGFRPTITINSLFLSTILHSNNVRKQFTFLAQGISRYNISKVKSMEIRIGLPSIEEQEIIGDFFRKLDRMIELQEREIELLEETKKGFLQKMFV